jgi:hypothetical protein
MSRAEAHVVSARHRSRVANGRAHALVRTSRSDASAFRCLMLTGGDASSIAMRDVDWGLKIGDTLDTSSYASGNGFAISSGRMSTRH